MQVFKFLDAHHAIDDLRHHRLKVSEFSDMNDPFELRGALVGHPRLQGRRRGEAGTEPRRPTGCVGHECECDVRGECDHRDAPERRARTAIPGEPFVSRHASCGSSMFLVQNNALTREH
jgi:hypothetical protein